MKLSSPRRAPCNRPYGDPSGREAAGAGRGRGPGPGGGAEAEARGRDRLLQGAGARRRAVREKLTNSLL